MNFFHVSTHFRMNSSNSCTIIINNATRHPNIFKKTNEIVKNYATGQELFFGHYKKDGVYLSKKDFSRYGTEIFSFFSLYGDFIDLKKGTNKSPFRSVSDLIVCRAPYNEKIFETEIMYKISQYYLETVFFCPKVPWHIFVHSYQSYMKNVTREYISRGYTDFMFSYVDSGDFTISFDPQKYPSRSIYEQINKLITKNTGDGFLC